MATTKEKAPAVYAAINAVMAQMAKTGISKDSNNRQQGYNFRGIDDIYNALSALLSEHGLSLLPNVTSREQVERRTAKGGALFYTNVTVEYHIVCSADGSIHKCTVVGEAMDTADKSTNKAMSAAFKYLCLQVFCIPTEGDNDADATTHEVAQPTAEQQTTNNQSQNQQPAAKPDFMSEKQTAAMFDMAGVVSAKFLEGFKNFVITKYGSLDKVPNTDRKMLAGRINDASAKKAAADEQQAA